MLPKNVDQLLNKSQQKSIRKVKEARTRHKIRKIALVEHNFINIPLQKQRIRQTSQPLINQMNPFLTQDNKQQKKFIPITFRIVSKDNNNIVIRFSDITIHEPQLAESIEYLTHHRAINSSITNEKDSKEPEVLTVDERVVTEKALRTIFDILKAFNYKIPVPGKVSSNNARDAVGPIMYEILFKMSNDELERLYSAAHFLSMKNLRLHIASMFAAIVFVQPKLSHFNQRREELGVTAPYDYQYVQSLAKKEEEFVALK